MTKTVLVTGGTGNLGKTVVQKFLSEGYKVIITISPGKKPEINDGNLTTIEADLTDESSAADAVQQVISRFGSIDAAVLLVGGYASGTISDTTGSDLRKMYSLNFETAYFITRPVFAQMIKQALGRIVFIGSRPSLQPRDGKGSLAYALSKSMLFKLADFLNAEGSSKNVIASVVVPSTIDTPVNRKAMPDADFTKWVKPDEIANVISFAVSDSSSVVRDPVYKVYGNA